MVPPLSYKAKSLLLCWEKPGRIYQKFNKLTFKPVTEQNEKKKLYTLLLHFKKTESKDFFCSHILKNQPKPKYTSSFLCGNVQIIFPLSMITRAHYTKISLYYQAQLCQMKIFAQLKVIITQLTCFNYQRLSM